MTEVAPRLAVEVVVALAWGVWARDEFSRVGPIEAWTDEHPRMLGAPQQVKPLALLLLSANRRCRPMPRRSASPICPTGALKSQPEVGSCFDDSKWTQRTQPVAGS